MDLFRSVQEQKICEIIPSQIIGEVCLLSFSIIMLCRACKKIK